MNINWKWPHTPSSGWRPWYEIAWALIFFIPAVVSILVFSFCIGAINLDWRLAVRTFRDNS